MSGRTESSILTQPVLVVSQKTKFIEVNNEYTIHDRDGEHIGDVLQVGQNLAKKALRFLGTPADRFLNFKLEVRESDGAVLLRLTRPAKLQKSRLVVDDGDGNEIGQISQQNALGKIRFSLEASGQDLGTISGEDFSSTGFAIQDHLGQDIGRISQSLDGLSLLDLFATHNDRFGSADSYALELTQPVTDPLRSLVIAAAIGIDLAIRQD